MINLSRMLFVVDSLVNKVTVLRFISDKMLNIILPKSFALASSTQYWTINICGSCFFSGACVSARQKGCQKFYCWGHPNGSYNCTPTGNVFQTCCSLWG